MRPARASFLVPLVALAAIAMAAPARRPIPAPGRDLVDNADLETGTEGRPAGWNLGATGGASATWGPHGVDGSRGVRLELARAGASAFVNRRLGRVASGAELTVTAWLRLTGFHGACSVWARCDGASGPERREGAFANSSAAGYAPSGDTIWSPVTVRVKTSAETAAIVLGVLVRGRGTVDVDEIHVRAPVARGRSPSATPPPAGPGLFRLEGRYRARIGRARESMTVLLPVPILWRDQIPLSFAVAADPAAHLGSFRLERRDDGHLVARVELRDLRPGGHLAFRWDAHMLVLPHTPSPIPPGIRLPLPPESVPEEVRPWLAATWCCDAEDPAIRAVADEIAKAGDTADVRIPATLARMKEIFRAATGHVASLVATEALERRGSCTSCANLGAALLRAQGIPARIVAGYPSWSGPLQTHYVVEYWLPGAGWRVMESTLCRDDRPGWEQLQVAVVRPEDEAEKRAHARVGAAPGVPYLSLTEYPWAGPVREQRTWLVGDMPGKPGCDHRAVQVTRLDATPAAWKIARDRLGARWKLWMYMALTAPPGLDALAPPAGLEEAESLDALRKLFE